MSYPLILETTDDERLLKLNITAIENLFLSTEFSTMEEWLQAEILFINCDVITQHNTFFILYLLYKIDWILVISYVPYTLSRILVSVQV